MPARVERARTVEDVERLAPLWDGAGWVREEAERDYLLTRVKLRSEAVAPFGALAVAGERVVAALAGRIEERSLPATVGYRTVYAPRVRILQLVEGGGVASDGSALDGPLGVVRAMLRSGEIDAVAVPPLRVGSAVHSAFAQLGGPLERQPFIRAWQRRTLALPESFDAYLASRRSKIRLAIRHYGKRLVTQLGADLQVQVIDSPSQAESFVADAESIARTTYQRAAGSGFADTDEQRELLRLGLERGWTRAYMLRHGPKPIAFWLCSTYRSTIMLRTTGYLAEYERDRVGTYLLMRVIEDACRDPDLRTLDFGPGDAEYKRHFSSDAFLEQNMLVFATTMRGRRINLSRGAILGGGALARHFSDLAGVTQRVQTAWRRRLRQGEQ